MPEFHFDEELHLYTLDGRKLENVTDVLRDVGLTECYGTEEHLARGNRVHEACRLRLLGILDESTVALEDEGYLSAFDSFLGAHVLDVDPWVSEVATYHPQLLYGMRPDFVGGFNGRRCLIDWQSGLLGTSKKYQTAAYACNPKIGPIDDRFGLQLRKDARYNLEPYHDPSDVDVWYSALTVYRAKRR